jgi:hypothetical protein
MKSKVFPDQFCFLPVFKLPFSTLKFNGRHFFKMASVRVRFIPGFLSGEGFPAKQFAPACTYRSALTPEQLQLVTFL